MTDDITHDIRNTIASIKAYVQLLRRKVGKNLDPAVDEYLTSIDEKLDTLTKQINKR